MNHAAKFATVDLILGSGAETRGVDAFALSLIKAERQIRRLLTHLVYQFPCFGVSDIPSLRKALGDSKKVYFDGVEKGIDALSPAASEVLVGVEYARLRPRLSEAIDHRNKIFHGQLTSRHLNRNDLVAYVEDIRMWCQRIANGALQELGYDGFARDSFQKSTKADLAGRLKVQFASIDDYRRFIGEKIERRL